LHDRLRRVVLAHLSEQNNHPEKALSAAGRALAGHPARLSVGMQDKATELFRV
ncbi:MAG: MBL fold metallo-hydrolase, partial [Desulfobacterales bacterium]|nr:MBL fold metallo-hydrolase [Desulfobacterales bacterium]